MDKVDSVHSADSVDKADSADSVACVVNPSTPDRMLTEKERQDLQTYLTEMDKLREADPVPIPSLDDNDGEDFGQFADDHVDLVKGYLRLTSKYYDTIIKALNLYHSIRQNTETSEIPDTVRQLLQDVNEKTTSGITAMRSELKEVRQYGLIKDNAHTAMLGDIPEILEQDNGQLYLGWTEVSQGSQGGEPVPILLSLGRENTSIKTSERITPADDMVCGAVANLIVWMVKADVSGPWRFTTQDIWRQLKYGDWRRTDKRPKASELKAIDSNMDNLQKTVLYLDYTNEIEMNLISDDDKEKLLSAGYDGIIKENYLMCRSIPLIAKNGKTMHGYEVYKLPALYDYCMARGHIVLVDPDLLDISDTIPRIDDGDYITEMKMYFLREIECMNTGRRGNYNSTKISYDAMYASTGIPRPADRVDRSKYSTDKSYNAKVRSLAHADRENIKLMLTSWKDKKWINGWQDLKAGRTITGIRIMLNPNRPQKHITEAEPVQAALTDGSDS